MFWRKKTDPIPLVAETCARALYDYLLTSLQDKKGVRVEDLVTAAAAIVGERCIEAAGDGVCGYGTI